MFFIGLETILGIGVGIFHISNADSGKKPRIRNFGFKISNTIWKGNWGLIVKLDITNSP